MMLSNTIKEKHFCTLEMRTFMTGQNTDVFQCLTLKIERNYDVEN